MTLTVNDEQESKTFNKALLYHFIDPNLNATANIFTAAVNWGDNSTNNISSDGSGTVSVVADQDGGFDVLGSHTYVEEGNYGPSVVVTGLDGTTYSNGNNANVLFAVADAPLTAGALTPPPNATINQPVASPVFPANTVLFNFFNVAILNSSSSDFTATVNWGDGTSNTNKDGSGTVSVAGAFALTRQAGFDVVGVSHTYTQPGTYQISVSVVGDGQTFNSPDAFTFIQGNGDRLFHFTDANPNATASDYTATVQWGDGMTSTITSTVSSVGQIVADPEGGFDVYGSHSYTSIVGWPTPATFSVTVNDPGGSSISASDTNFRVLNQDQRLTAGTLDVPSVTTEGQSITNQVLLHFSDADTSAQASDYLATVSWGDSTFNDSDDDPNNVRVVANTTIGGFDVVGSHVYSEGSFIFGVTVTDKGDLSSAQPDNGGQSISAVSASPLSIAELSVIPAAGPGFTASPNTLSTVQTVATFTDPGGPESDAGAYVAIVQWGDGTVTATSLNAQANYGQASVDSQGKISGMVVSASNVGGIVRGSDSQPFSVNLAHQYAEAGAYAITTTILHDGTNSGSVTTQAVVADQVAATGGFSIEGTAGMDTGNQTVATFTDPEGAGPLSDYSASINWGDGTASQPDISSGGISFDSTTQVFTVSASHTYAHVGASYPITVVIENLNAFPVTVGSVATISPATPTVPTPIVPINAVYNGQPQGATVGDVTGINSVDLGAPTLTYYAGTFTLATLPSSGSSTAPTDAGNYTVVASYGGSTDYTAASSIATYSIAKADAVVTVTGYTGAYDAQAHGATGSVTGVDAGGTAAGTSLNLGASFTYAPGGTAHWVFTGGTNYNDQSGDVAIVITAKALSSTASTQSALNIAKNGMLSFQINVNTGGIVDGQSIAQLFDGMSFSLSVGGRTYSVQAVATVTDGVITVSFHMTDDLKALLAAFTSATNASNAPTVGISLHAVSKDGNYALDATATTKLFNSTK